MVAVRNIRMALLLLMVLPALSSAQALPPKEALARMKVPAGLRVKLFASEPMIRQPVAMTFDDRGRLWVIQYLQYPNPAGLKPVKIDQYLRTVYDRVPEPPPKGPKGLDRITILEDTNGDGVADTAKDFVTGLNLATGLLVGNGGVYVVQAPYLLFYPDRDHDDVPDEDPQVLLTGFGMEDAHATANSLNWGPDGWIYGAQGSTVTAHIRGIEFQQGIWRYHPRTHTFELFSEGGGNIWGLDFDRFGNALAGTNYGGAAMLHAVQGGYYVKGFEKHGALHNANAFGYFEHVPHSDFHGGHVTCGGIVYQGDALPKEFQNQYIACNLLSNAVHWHKIVRDGSTFKNSFGGELLTTDDRWFRPIDIETGPDGALYIADWYDQRANHVDPKDDWHKTSGRIYKVESVNAKPPRPIDWHSCSDETLVDYLSSSNIWVRKTARRLLSESGAATRDHTKQLLLKRILYPDPKEGVEPVEFLWALYGEQGLDVRNMQSLVFDPNEAVRLWTIRFLGDANLLPPKFSQALSVVARHKDFGTPAVQSQIASSAARVPAQDAIPILQALMEDNRAAKDPQIPMLVWWAYERKLSENQKLALQILSDPKVWQAPIFRSTIAERIVRRFAMSGSAADYAICAKMLDSAPDDGLRQVLLRGLDLGLEGKKNVSLPAALTNQLANLSAAAPTNILLHRLLLRIGATGALRHIQELVDSGRIAVKSQVDLIELVGRLAPEGAQKWLTHIWQSSKDEAIKRATLKSLAAQNDASVAEILLADYSSATKDLQSRIRDALCSRVNWATQLIAAVDAGQISAKEFSDDQLQRLALLTDPNIATAMEKHWGRIHKQALAGETLARIHGLNVMLKGGTGTPSRGHELFKKNCMICHTLFGEGNHVGPDLTGADRKDTRFLLTSLVEPSSVIRKEYVASVIYTTDGRVLTGIITQSTPNSITLVDNKNQKILLAASDAETIKPSDVSLMPEKLLDPLSPDEIRDLFAYLQLPAKLK